MIKESINQRWKLSLARTGDAVVFGEDSGGRRKMDDLTALSHFTKVWDERLEPEIRKAPIVTPDEAKELLEGKPRDYAIDGYQFRQCSLHSAVFLARLNNEATEDGVCDQLWPIGMHRDNTRLCIFFDTVADRERFEYIASQLQKQPKLLALSLVMDFIKKFPE